MIDRKFKYNSCQQAKHANNKFWFFIFLIARIRPVRLIECVRSLSALRRCWCQSCDTNATRHNLEMLSIAFLPERPNGRLTIYSHIQGGTKTNMVYTRNSSRLQRGHCVMMRRNKHKHLRGNGNAHVFTRLRKLTDHRSLIFVCLRFSSIEDKCAL